MFAKQLREGIRRGRICCTVRIWMSPRVRVGGRYAMDDGLVVVDSIERIKRGDITRDLAGESGFDSVADLLRIARHGKGRNVYLIRFHYLRPGAWDSAAWSHTNARPYVRGMPAAGRRTGSRATKAR